MYTTTFISSISVRVLFSARLRAIRRVADAQRYDDVRLVSTALFLSSSKIFRLRRARRDAPRDRVTTRVRVFAGLLSALFRGTDLVPSDVVAGCILLRVRQKRETHELRRLNLIARPKYTTGTPFRRFSIGEERGEERGAEYRARVETSLAN